MPRIAVIPGDGVGPEVVDEVIKALALLAGGGLPLSWSRFDYGAERFLRTGEALPEGALDELRSFDAIFLGALGDPRIPDSAHARGILLELRFRLDLYVNLRPVKVYDASLSPLRDAEGVDFAIVRENTEGAYAGAGGFLRKGTPDEVAIQDAVATRLGVERVLRHAFALAASKPRPRLVMADKHNALRYVSDLWHRIFLELAEAYPSVEARHLFADVLLYEMVRDPRQFGIVVTSNLFGDLASDLGAGIAGSLGLAPSASYNPETRAALFEPVHGSAPGLAGKGLANPFAALLSASMMLEFLGFGGEAKALETAVASCVREGKTTADLGGTLSTSAAGDAVRRALQYGD